jgi:hypothetical protein
MLGHCAIGEHAILSIPLGSATPYEIELDDETEIDVVNLVIFSPYVEPETTG